MRKLFISSICLFSAFAIEAAGLIGVPIGPGGGSGGSGGNATNIILRQSTGVHVVTNSAGDFTISAVGSEIYAEGLVSGAMTTNLTSKSAFYVMSPDGSSEATFQVDNTTHILTIAPDVGVEFTAEAIFDNGIYGNAVGCTNLNALTALNAWNYGAFTNTASDQTAALQSAIDAASNGWNTVDVPSGVYNITTLYLKKGVSLRGMNPSFASAGVVFNCTGTGRGIVLQAGRNLIDGINFTGTGSNEAIGTTNTTSSGTTAFTIKNCRFDNFANAISLTNAWNIVLDGNSFTACKSGILASNTVNTVKVANSIFSTSGKPIYIQGGSCFSWLIIGNDIESSTNGVVLGNTPANIAVIANHFEGNTNNITATNAIPLALAYNTMLAKGTNIYVRGTTLMLSGGYMQGDMNLCGDSTSTLIRLNPYINASGQVDSFAGSFVNISNNVTTSTFVGAPELYATNGITLNGNRITSWPSGGGTGIATNNGTGIYNHFTNSISVDGTNYGTIYFGPVADVYYDQGADKFVYGGITLGADGLIDTLGSFSVVPGSGDAGFDSGGVAITGNSVYATGGFFVTGPTNYIANNFVIGKDTRVGRDLYVTITNATSLATDSNGKVIAGSASGGGGTNSGPITLTISGGAIAVNAATPVGCVTNAVIPYRVSMTGDATLSNPTGMLDGQRITIEFTQDATGNRVLTTDTAYAFGTDITGLTLSTNANTTDFATFIYNSTAAKWRCVGFVRGY